MGILFSVGLFLQIDRLMSEYFIDTEQKLIRQELHSIYQLIDQWKTKLQATGNIAVYQEDFKSAVIKELKNKYYKSLKKNTPYPYILNYQGQMIMHPSIEVGTAFQKENVNFTLAEMLQSGERNYTYLGQKKWMKNLDVPDWQWIVSMSTSYEYMYRDRDRIRQAVVLGFGVFGIFFFGIFYLFAQRLLAPVQNISEAAKQLHKGNLNFELQGDFSGELGLLAEQFKTMQVSVRTKIEDLEQIIHTASHDLRSPLVNIMGFTRELRESLNEIIDLKKEEDISNSMEVIEKNTQRINHLINGILQISRLERKSIVKENVDLKSLLEQLIQENSYSLKTEQVKVKIEGSNWQKVRGNGDELFQLFSNLLTNAVRYKDQTKEENWVKISCKKLPQKIEVHFCDNGVGIEKKYQQQIFKLFNQLNPRQHKGEGIGLAICRRIAHRHHGYLTVESTPGQGSCFIVSLNSSN
jgi:signal transduction histidine kinase